MSTESTNELTSDHIPTPTTLDLGYVLTNADVVIRTDRVRRTMVDGRHKDGYETRVRFPSTGSDRTFRITAAGLDEAGILRSWPLRKEHGIIRTLDKAEPAPVEEGEAYPPSQQELTELQVEKNRLLGKLSEVMLGGPQQPAEHAAQARLLNCMLQANAVHAQFMAKTGSPLSDQVQRLGVTIFLREYEESRK